MLARTALYAGLLLPLASNADQKPAAPIAEHDVYVEVHGLAISWNGKPLGKTLSLEAMCKALRGQIADAQFTVASGIDTSQFEVRRIVKVLKGACGAHCVAYEILIRLNNKT